MQKRSKTTEKLYVTSVATRMGTIHLASTQRGVARIALPGENHKTFFTWLVKTFPKAEISTSGRVNEKPARQLREYFEGKRRKFNFRLDLRTTPFQSQVLRKLRRIPYGKTASYGEIAKKMGRTKASRAVGLACGSNPLPVVIPCHRVIGANGSLTGFGGGLKMKAAMLALERTDKR